jgi:hypothetical protein
MIAYTTWIFGFLAYLFVSICYQRVWGQAPFNNALSVGFPRFYFEFYASDCQKLNGTSLANLGWNVLIYTLMRLIYQKFLRPFFQDKG